MIQENVERFPVGYIMHFLKDLYDVQHMTLSAPCFGFPSWRSRQYVVLSHKAKVGAMLFPFNQFTKLLERDCVLTWYAWLCDQDDGDDALDELREAAAKRFKNNRKNQRSRQVESGEPLATRVTADELREHIQELDVHAFRAYEHALPSFEESMLAVYRSHVSPRSAWSLNQNPTGLAAKFRSP